MGDPITMKRGDRKPSLRAQLRYSGGQSAGLADATSVAFRMASLEDGAVKIDLAPVTVEDEDTGVVRYDWAANDTDQIGRFAGEFVVTYPGGLVQTFPSTEDFIAITVNPNAADIARGRTC